MDDLLVCAPKFASPGRSKTQPCLTGSDIDVGPIRDKIDAEGRVISHELRRASRGKLHR